VKFGAAAQSEATSQRQADPQTEDAVREGEPDKTEEPAQRVRFVNVPRERDPVALTSDMISGLVNVPLFIVGVVLVVSVASGIKEQATPPPPVTLSESLSALMNIEDEYTIRGPSMRLRQRLAQWYQWAQPDRRLKFELRELPAGPLKEKAEKRGKDATEFLDQAVSYSTPSQGIADPSATSGWGEDDMAADMARKGYPEVEKFSEQALKEGRKALSEAVRTINEAMYPE